MMDEKMTYVVVEEFEWNGATMMADQKVELTEEEAAPLLEEGKIKMADASEEEEDEDDDDAEDEDESDADTAGDDAM